MKKNLIITFLAVASVVCIAATFKPEPIRSKLVEIHSKGWYEEKFRSWADYLVSEEGSKLDWFEFFKAAFYADQPKSKLAEISASIDQKFSGTFESYYVKSKLYGWNEDGIRNLEKALELAENQTELIPDRIVLSEAKQQKENREQLSSELFESKVIYPSLLNYSYNVLMSVNTDGVLIVQGTPTTVPLYVLQDVLKVRKDIKILNLDLAENQEYLEHWTIENQLNTGSSLDEIVENNQEAEFYYGLTMPSDQLSDVEDRLYIVGLASLLSEKPFDHYGTLKENLESKFLLDYLTVNFNGEPKYAAGRVYENNYIVPFLLLKEYYEEVGNANGANEWESRIIEIAERNQIKNRVVQLMNKRSATNSISFKVTDIEVKDLDKKMSQIKNNLYASNVEVTNKEYWEYLNYLRVNEYEDLYKLSLPNLSKYDQLTASFMKNYHYSPANYNVYVEDKKNKKPSYLDYPAVDMTYEAVNAYCEWLTFQYNNQTDRKYKQVKFRLPDKKEWSVAALGYKDFNSWNLDEITVKAWGEEDWDQRKGTKKDQKNLKEYNVKESNILYPWWYPNVKFASSITNQMDCYLANVKTPEEVICKGGVKGDGFTLMSPVATYFANPMGLYDVIGNVAEMIDEEGMAMGGSWNHPAEESTIRSIYNYSDSDASVGFRLFMEVIEE